MSRQAFRQIQTLFFEHSGIALADDKRALVESRLTRRLRLLNLESFDEYVAFVLAPEGRAERQHAVDLLTTNETYFFREAEQFQVLSSMLDSRYRGLPVRIWSAACSTGEEPYSLAMLLLDRRPEGGWELRASDLSLRVLEHARRGVFPLKRLEHMPNDYLKRFCLRGKGEYAGSFRVDDQVRRSVHFFQHNLMHDAATVGTYEVIFLRNVLIYFDQAARQKILSQLVDRLRPNGLLFIGHAESLQGLTLPLGRVARSVFEKV